RLRTWPLNRSCAPQPPGPGLPLQAPSVWMMTCFKKRLAVLRPRSLPGRFRSAIDDATLRRRQADTDQRLDLRPLHAADEVHRQHAFARTDQVGLGERHHQVRWRPAVADAARRQPRKPDAVAADLGYVEVEQLQPVLHATGAIKAATARKRAMPQTDPTAQGPDAPRAEAEDKQATAVDENTDDLAQYVVRRTAGHERVRPPKRVV